MMFAWIPVFPLVGFLVNGLLGIKFFSKRAVQTVAIGAVGLSFAASVVSFVRLLGSAEPVIVKSCYTWIPASLVRVFGGRLQSFGIDLAFRYDSLAAVMTLVVTGVGLLIHIYSIGYMAHDKSTARFFAYLNLFTFAMLVLVLGRQPGRHVHRLGGRRAVLLSPDRVLVLPGRGGQRREKGLHHEPGRGFRFPSRPRPPHLLPGDSRHRADLRRRRERARRPGTATAAALLLFLGATGKSAQIPLYTWLPDAMEGPTPVSALIHAATMVTAGVYMVARMHALFSFSGTALDVVALVGALTAVYAATMGFVQNDIKRVLAYSTISQIGYMFIGLGVGAYSAGIFHLMTHAFFKSLLFLAAGSVIHALSGEQDMRKMGGLKSRLPVTYPVFLAGALAIAGVPGLSGFFSKDEILASAFASGHYAVWALGLAGAGMTSFYIFRLIFLTFHGRERLEPDARRHLHESPRTMTAPLGVLAVLSIVGGYVGLPRVLGGKDWFAGFLASSTGVSRHPLAGPTEILLMLVSAGVGLAGIWAAYEIYVKKEGLPAERMAARFKAVYRLVSRKYYVDEIYDRVAVRGTLALGRLAGWFDARVIDGLVDGSAWLARKSSSASMAFDEEVVDGAVNGIGRAHRSISRGLRKLQTGYVYNYALAIVIGLVILVSLAVTIF